MAKRKSKKNMSLKLIVLLLLLFGVSYYYKKNKGELNGPSIVNKDMSVFKNDQEYNSSYEKYYESINYLDNQNFLKNVNALISKKYSPEEINIIFSNLSDKNISKLLEKNYINVTDYYKIKNFDVNKYDRYENYKKKNSSLDIQTVVTYVNLDLDIEDYTDMNTISNPDDFFVIVNKHNKLPDGYAPKDLEAVISSNALRTKVRKEVVEPIKELMAAAKKEGHNLYQTTSYRDYGWQKSLYDNYVSKDGKDKADTYSARPGNSEHQTGYAIDLANSDLNGTGTRLNESDAKWIKENCYKYGFILRYTEENKHITRYMAESWHIRYVGIDAAKLIYENNLSLEEYVDLYLTEY